MSWDHDVTLTVHVRVKGEVNPERFEGWRDRKPEHAASTALALVDIDLANTDGFADLIGSAWVTHIEVESSEPMRSENHG